MKSAIQLSEFGEDKFRFVDWIVLMEASSQKMDNYSAKISERMWNQPDKGEREAERENTFIDDIIQKSHIERELLQSLDGIKTAFDGGAVAEGFPSFWQSAGFM